MLLGRGGNGRHRLASCGYKSQVGTLGSATNHLDRDNRLGYWPLPMLTSSDQGGGEGGNTPRRFASYFATRFNHYNTGYNFDCPTLILNITLFFFLSECPEFGSLLFFQFFHIFVFCILQSVFSQLC